MPEKVFNSFFVKTKTGRWAFLAQSTTGDFFELLAINSIEISFEFSKKEQIFFALEPFPEAKTAIFFTNKILSKIK